MIGTVAILALIITVLVFISYIQAKEIAKLRLINNDMSAVSAELRDRLSAYSEYSTEIEVERRRQDEEETEIKRVPDSDLIARANALFPGMQNDQGKH